MPGGCRCSWGQVAEVPCVCHGALGPDVVFAASIFTSGTEGPFLGTPMQDRG